MSMNPLNTDSELLKAAQIAQSPVVRILAQRLADRATQATTARDTLTTIREHVRMSELREALQLIDQTRAALDWARSIPNHNEVK
jgi:hypothetical protein